MSPQRYQRLSRKYHSHHSHHSYHISSKFFTGGSRPLTGRKSIADNWSPRLFQRYLFINQNICVQRLLLRMSVLIVMEKKQFFSVAIFIWRAFPLAQVRFEGDTKNFDDYPETDWASVKKVSERQLAMFEDFWAGARNFFWEQDQRKAWSVIYGLTTSLFNSTNIWWL